VDGRENTEALVEKLSFMVAYGSAPVVSVVTGASPMTIRLSPGNQLCSQSLGPDRDSVYSAVWVWPATSSLRQTSEEQRQIKGEVDEWRKDM
jgi:hypothetical protein